MQILSQLLFALVLLAVGVVMARRIGFIRRGIALGQPEDRSDRPAERWATMLRVAFGQKKMFDRPLVGLLHFVIYAGFLLINLEVLEIILDGLLGTHRLFAGALGGFYTFLINFFELLAVAVLSVCVVFLIRRDARLVGRLQPARHRELRGWPVLDANVILLFEIFLMLALLSMNAADALLQQRSHPHYPAAGPFFFSSWLQPLFAGLSTQALVVLERACWWVHILGIFAFGIYVTYSKHLHIFLAFPSTYFARLLPKGQMQNMPQVTQEVKIMLGLAADGGTPAAEVGRFGARDVTDLSWKNLLDAYTCTECGRCTDECPANLTGKLLSPRKIMMDTRDRMEEITRQKDAAGGQWTDDGRALFGDYISAEELRACTTCNACVQACPILLNPLDIILQLRRYQNMELSDAPASWNMMFQNLENNQAPWKMPASDRFNWADKVQ